MLLIISFLVSSYVYPQDLIPPSNFVATSDSNQVNLSWELPFDSIAGQVPTNLSSFNIYRNDSLLISCGAQTTSMSFVSFNGLQYYSLTAVYDLTPYGFPGQFGESGIAGPDTLIVAYGFPLPFSETWSSSTLSTQLWTAEQGWYVDNLSGFNWPDVKFDGTAGYVNYNRSLESYWINPTSITSTSPYSIYLEFDLRLIDQSGSGSEKLDVEVWDGSAWYPEFTYANTGTQIWQHEKLDISVRSKHHAFKFRFRASGIHSTGIDAWFIDNIHIYSHLNLYPPTNLNAYWYGNPQNDVLLTWTLPQGSGTPSEYVLDDNSAENGWAISPGYDSWLGNEFDVNDVGKLVSADVYWQSNSASGGETVTIDVFNNNFELVGSSEPFVPMSDSWQTIYLPDINLDGNFIMMVHWNMLAGQTNYLGSDEDGPNVQANKEWYYDGNAWAHLTDYGYNPCVFLIRAYALLGDSKKDTLLSTGLTQSKKGSITPLNANSSGRDSGCINSIAQTALPGYTDSPCELLGYNIYHMLIQSFLGQWDTICPWTLIGTAQSQASQYIENDVFGGIYAFYRITALYNEGESEFSNVDWVIPEGIENIPVTGIKCYPNPADDKLHIATQGKVKEVMIHDTFGRLLNKKELNEDTDAVLETSRLCPNVYFVELVLKDCSHVTWKVVVNH